MPTSPPRRPGVDQTEEVATWVKDMLRRMDRGLALTILSNRVVAMRYGADVQARVLARAEAGQL